MKERKSAVELIKIFAVAMIVLCHAVPDSFVFADGTIYSRAVPTANPLFLLISFIAGLGLAGDVIFIVCSSYFLADSKKFKVSKISTMILNVFLISLVFMSVILALGYELSPLAIVKQVFPTIFQNNWFISYYILFYLLHPLFNAIIEKLDKKCHAIVALGLFIHCSIVLYALGNPPGINKFLCFVSIYFIVAFLKKYGQSFCNSKKLNILLCVISAVLYIVLRVGLNYLGLRIDYLENRMLGYAHINCPILIVFSISLFNLANMQTWRCKFINYLSSLSLLVYIIHHNNLFATYIQPQWFPFFVGNAGHSSLLSASLLLAAIYFVASVALASAYRFSIEIAIKKISSYVDKGVTDLIQKLKRRYEERKAASLKSCDE